MVLRRWWRPVELGVGRRYAALRVAHVTVGVGLCSLVGTPAFSARRRQRLPRARRGRWRLPGLVDLQREVIKTHDAVVSDRPLYVTANILSYGGGGEHGWPRMGASAGEAFFLLHRPSWQTFFVADDGRSRPHWCVLPRFFTSFWVSFTLSLFPSREVALSHYQILHRLLDLTGCSYGPAYSCSSALFYAVRYFPTSNFLPFRCLVPG